MAHRTVLFVDDEPNVLSALRRLLRKEEYASLFAESGTQGLELLRQHEVHLVVSDQRMPDMEGTHFLQKVKEGYPYAVRVILSGYADAAVIVDSINKGEIYRFIAKPWTDETLKVSLRQCLEHYDILEQNRALMEQTRLQNEQLKQLNEHLEEMVALRTTSLQMSQEILEKLPAAVIGVNREGEIVLRNRAAGEMIGTLCNLIPGTDASDVLPVSISDALADVLERPESDRKVTFVWSGKACVAHIAALGSRNERGCLVMFTYEAQPEAHC